jgi:hypothetical protein
LTNVNFAGLSVFWGKIGDRGSWVGLVVTIDLTDYALMPIDRLLGMLAWMVEKG